MNVDVGVCVGVGVNVNVDVGVCVGVGVGVNVDVGVYDWCVCFSVAHYVYLPFSLPLLHLTET